ncbi:uncharacterized protein K441DRAFT_251070 [Cenococcum geophilum 1.58]|uniref:uncharacterized protein n=1 Tax=Cenococcum geophilum 1.58 TaxID=794803 RepID=UPI00358E9BA6|nr:hypothetical protein K441DRAFT_251070 [Cenococcum geophilum 1.58]
MTAIVHRSLSVSDTISVIGLVLNVVIGICTILISWAVWRLTQKLLRGRDLESDNLAVSLVVERHWR